MSNTKTVKLPTAKIMWDKVFSRIETALTLKDVVQLMGDEFDDAKCRSALTTLCARGDVEREKVQVFSDKPAILMWKRAERRAVPAPKFPVLIGATVGVPGVIVADDQEARFSFNDDGSFTVRKAGGEMTLTHLDVARLIAFRNKING